MFNCSTYEVALASANERQITLQNVPELRKFIDMGQCLSGRMRQFGHLQLKSTVTSFHPLALTGIYTFGRPYRPCQTLAAIEQRALLPMRLPTVTIGATSNGMSPTAETHISDPRHPCIKDSVSTWIIHWQSEFSDTNRHLANIIVVKASDRSNLYQVHEPIVGTRPHRPTRKAFLTTTTDTPVEQRAELSRGRISLAASASVIYWDFGAKRNVDPHPFGNIVSNKQTCEINPIT